MFWSLKRSTTLPSSNWSGKPTLTRLGGSESTLGNRKRTVPSVMASSAAVIVVQPTANQLPTRTSRKKRRVLPAGLAGALAAGAAGFGAAGAGLGVTAAGVGLGAGLGVPLMFVFGSDMTVSALPDR